MNRPFQHIHSVSETADLTLYTGLTATGQVITTRVAENLIYEAAYVLAATRLEAMAASLAAPQAA